MRGQGCMVNHLNPMLMLPYEQVREEVAAEQYGALSRQAWV
jgi:hypothetical protein